MPFSVIFILGEDHINVTNYLPAWVIPTLREGDRVELSDGFTYTIVPEIDPQAFKVQTYRQYVRDYQPDTDVFKTRRMCVAPDETTCLYFHVMQSPTNPKPRVSVTLDNWHKRKQSAVEIPVGEPPVVEQKPALVTWYRAAFTVKDAAGAIRDIHTKVPGLHISFLKVCAEADYFIFTLKGIDGADELALYKQHDIVNIHMRRFEGTEEERDGVSQYIGNTAQYIHEVCIGHIGEVVSQVKPTARTYRFEPEAGFVVELPAKHGS